MTILQQIAYRYYQQFKQQYILVKAPGRFNLIGEHVDYNLGLVLPAAIDKHIYLALGKSNDTNLVEIFSPYFNQTARFTCDNDSLEGLPSWIKYLKATIIELKARGYALEAVNGAIDGDIPLGAGLSSSAALCCGFIYGISYLNQLKIPRNEIAVIAQATEHRVGLNCGLMDQYAVLYGKAGHVIGLDCRSLNFRYIPLNLQEYSIVVANSKIKHELAAGSGYNERRAACERVVETINRNHAEVNSLRDVDFHTLRSYKDKVDAIDYKRANYVLEENQRVIQTMKALEDGRIASVGQYLYQSHYGMKLDYEITVPEIDLLVDLTKPFKEVIGSRMVGGGFGGCTINLIETAAKAQVLEHIAQEYENQFHVAPEFYDIQPDEGVHLVHAPA
ncbi:MAG: galactokinase [Saprospiraceae bacterium]|nr:galactokinase [Saprospiraceae bacterium]